VDQFGFADPPGSFMRYNLVAVYHCKSGDLAVSHSDLVFVGFNSHVAALHRETGEIVWEWTAPKPWSSGYVTLLLDGDRLIVAVNGYMYCLDPLGGEQLWHNEMSGFGTGVTSIASVRGNTSPEVIAMAAAEAARQAAASSTVTT
jgi:outer membrane protein assembly factor BamB